MKLAQTIIECLHHAEIIECLHHAEIALVDPLHSFPS